MFIFISHISEESGLALELRGWIESALQDPCKVFVSSDSAALPAGTRWINAIDDALRSATLMLVLCSAASLRRPWVNFETGCAWARAIPIIPICHSGVSRNSLPRPISEFQAIDLTDPKFSDLLFNALAKHLKLPYVPQVASQAMADAISSLLGKVSPPQRELGLPKTTQHVLAEESVSILQYLAKQRTPIPLESIKRKFKQPLQRSRFFVEELLVAGLVDRRRTLTGVERYSATASGRKELHARDML